MAVAGGGLMVVGALVFVFIARNRAILSRYAPGGIGVSPTLRMHIPRRLLAWSAVRMACKKRTLCQIVYWVASSLMGLSAAWC